MNDLEAKSFAACLRKKKYSTQALAELVSAKVMHERKKETRVYSCKECMGYHLTSQI